MKKHEFDWKKIIHFVEGVSIRKQLYGVYFVAMVVPILILGMALIMTSYNQLNDYHADLLDSDNTSVKNLLFVFTTQVRNLSEDLIFNEEIQEVLSGEFSSADDFRKKVDKISVLDSFKNNNVEIGGIEIYTDNPDAVEYRQFVKTTDEIGKSVWYQKAMKQSGVFWTSIVKKSTSGVPSYYLCLVRKIPLLDSNYNAVLVMRISDDYLRSSIENSSYQTYLAVEDEPAFYSSNRSKAGQPMPIEIDYGIAYYQKAEKVTLDSKICFAKVSSLNMYKSETKLYICTINRYGYYDIWHIMMICFVIMGMSIILPGILIFFFTHYLTKRIDLLRKEMHKASHQDYELMPIMYGDDEIAEAHADLQIMVEKIKEHEATVYESQLREKQLESEQREIEYKRLASQINPHFLYNTLETIRMKAFTVGDREVAQAIKLLGKSMRYVLDNTGTSMTTLAKELEHVEVYLQIQQLRFGDRFDYRFAVMDQINPEKIQMLPLLLQPLVENSVVHGLESLEENGHVDIEVYSGLRNPDTEEITREERNADILVIDITDNGEGMDEETLAKLRFDIEIRDVSRSKSIGLYNINQRVKLLYGQAYALQIDSALGKGTRVRLVMPLT